MSMTCIIAESRDEKIQISSQLDDMKSPITNVVVPGVTLFNLSFYEFVEMVTDYSKKRVDQDQVFHHRKSVT